ncbi:hypothetical protein G6O69_16255 [Pseudenhygromyxa sp. WMMC2535]|uniref:hypothetical protein n=1 Tax=Pseudenhygromyxa sp. WMMC2535 TaxID=2712867 RepID=UPI001557D630|nr:hypothetical protein [Pseudenhygromyxa sp. WMMC2535]NVB39396.1 hypothetical protein [Pseudenhygromyxa sp. WMMC2535]
MIPSSIAATLALTLALTGAPEPSTASPRSGGPSGAPGVGDSEAAGDEAGGEVGDEAGGAVEGAEAPEPSEAPELPAEDARALESGAATSTAESDATSLDGPSEGSPEPGEPGEPGEQAAGEATLGPVAVPAPPQAIAVDPKNYRMVLAGDVLVGLGGAAFIVMAAGLAVGADASRQHDALSVADEPDADKIAKQADRAALGRTLAITGGASAGALMITGIALIAAGRVRERKRREAMFASPLSLSLPLPVVGREQVGLSWSLRF